jgi:3-dehydroquinate synthase
MAAHDPRVRQGKRFEMRWNGHRSYDVVATHDLLRRAPGELSAAIGARRVLSVTTPTVDALHGRALQRHLRDAGVDADHFVVQLGEAHKTMESVLALCGHAQRAGLGRRDLLLAFGGGVCCDVVGLAASLTRRGLPYICVPTTLLAQVDAAIGLKTGVNFGGRKNYLGSFVPPEAVFVDIGFLRTLPADDLRRGTAEILKIALVRDEELFSLLTERGPELLESHFASPARVADLVIHRSIALMLDELSRNPYEDRGYERLVDFGHTFSPAIEETSLHRVLHGDAVAIDIAVSCMIAIELGLLPEYEWHRILAAYRALGLPLTSVYCTADVLGRGVEAAVAHRGGRLNLVVPTTVGCATFVPDAASIDRGLLERAADRLALEATARPRATVAAT